MFGEAHGVELSANWKLTGSWSLATGVTYSDQHFHTKPQSLDTQTALFNEGNTPEWNSQLRSHVEMTPRLVWDASAYFVDALQNQGPLTNVRIPAYTRLDTGLTWKPLERFSLRVVGQNLLKDHHQEFDDLNGSMRSGQIKRSGYVQLMWQF